ncbi:unnamed protein product [Diatraea saccharalis]|uniref:Uncharacterized protein n=1 Tax=Diatraea saccharalis TaxID=40085 RepID=A0A9N9RFT9_9NEOP|nr:unnamed protein product [Diatraea saccharalis]
MSLFFKCLTNLFYAFTAIFLIKIIYKYLEDKSVKCLLNEESTKLLEKCMYIVKPGLRLACRFYWRKEGWYKMQNVKKILMGKANNEESGILDDSELLIVLKSLTDSALIIPSTDASSLMTFDDYAVVLCGNDLIQICKELKLKNVTNKKCAIDTLKSYSKRKSIKNFCTGGSEDNSRRVLKM